MGAKEKRQQERLEGILRRRAEAIQAAKALFKIKGIESTSMQDIADYAELGVASLYRYYNNKHELVMAVATDYVETAFNPQEVLLKGNGIEKLNQLLDYMFDPSRVHPDFLLFLPLFEHYQVSHVVALEAVDTPLIKRWHQEIQMLQKVIQEGIADKTIRKDIPTEDVAKMVMTLYWMLGEKIIQKQSTMALHQCSIKIYKDMVMCYVARAA